MGGGKLRVQDSINRAASFLCGFGPAGSKAIERPAAACLAWIGRGEERQAAGHCCCKKTLPRLFASTQAHAAAHALALIGLIENKP